MWRRLTLCLALAFTGACGTYDFTVNDTTVYSPRPLFSDFAVQSEILQACLEQAIADNKVVTAPELRSLNCSHAGIDTLEGLAVFTGLRQLKLTANAIRNLVELGRLSSLETLYLDDNRVIDPVPLFELPALQVLDLSGNNELQCPGPNALIRVEVLTLPAHCQH